jgi:hypothetical protein
MLNIRRDIETFITCSTYLPYLQEKFQIAYSTVAIFRIERDLSLLAV